MPTAHDVLSVAASQIGYTEYPPNSNKTKYGEWYGMNYEPWCDMFVSWCGAQVGALDIIGKFAYCPYHVTWFKNRGQWKGRDYTPKPGDIIFFANRSGVACHIGFVESVNGSTILTIEGNTAAGNNANGGQVQRRNRTLGTVGSSWYVLGYGTPAYSGEEVDDDMKLTDVVTRPDGQKTTVENILGFTDVRIEEIRNMVEAIYNEVCRTDNNGAGESTNSGATMSGRVPYIEEQVKLIAEKVGAKVV